jgi:hypothetical protein
LSDAAVAIETQQATHALTTRPGARATGVVVVHGKSDFVASVLADSRFVLPTDGASVVLLVQHCVVLGKTDSKRALHV